MKKVILGLSSIVLVAFVVILVANAQNKPQDVKKASTEMSKDCSKCPSAAACSKMKEANSAETKVCDPAKCKEMGCDPAKCKEGKCDPAACKTKCANDEGKKCCPAAGKACEKK
jgi:hypothetical protein